MHKHSRWHRVWKTSLTLLSLTAVLLIVCAGQAMTTSAAPAGQRGRGHHRDINTGPVDLPRQPAKSPHRPSEVISSKPVDPVMVGAHAVDPIDMKVLVISADGKESNLPMITAALGQIGVPYTVYQVINPTTGVKTPLTARMLWDGALHGYYQGVILTTDSLVYEVSPTNYPSAFTATEWQTLWTYESTFKIRQITLNTTGFGPETFGLTWPVWSDTTLRRTWQQTAATPINGTLTTAGQTQFPYLKPTINIPIVNADTVLATAGSGVTPLLTTTGGYALLSISTNTNDGRQNLAFTADGAPYLVHSLVLAYGMINWVNNGRFLGERHVYLTPQPDDIGIEDDVWNTQMLTDTTGLAIRMTGKDYNAAITWLNGVQANSTTSQFTIEWPFNGSGFSSTVYPGDTLTAAVLANSSKFRWINHTWSHQNMDAAGATLVTTELTKNNTWGTNTAKFTLNTNYFKDSMIQPDISGLYAPTFLQRAYNYGMRYIISDASRKPPQFADNWDNPSPNAGDYRGIALVNSQEPIVPTPSILVIPRKASNLFYNLYTPDQWVSEYNCYFSRAQTYPAGSVCAQSQWKIAPNGWDTNLNYNQIIDQESNIILQYLLKGDLSPIMFHQPNVVQYAPGKTLMGDLINATLLKYNNMMSLPIQTPGLHGLGLKMSNRMAYNASGVTAQMIPCGTLGARPSIILTTVKPALIPLTGVAYGNNKEVYGGQNISYVNLAANQSVTIPITCP
ncbi:MAG: hypothetical protein WCJ55_04480 [Chloroflexales bacterium]